MCPATQATQCHAQCGPLVPNGCDCFGCCELPAGSGRTVFLGSEPRNGAPRCGPETVNNPDSCRACKQVAECRNRCERCEVCIGRPTPPADCFVSGADGGSAPPDGGSNPGQCAAGVQPCGLPGQSPCPANAYCITGCCIVGPQ